MANRDDGSNSRRGPMIALGVIVFIFLLGWFLARQLYSNGQLEDCVLSGRTNCAPIATPQH
jgi:hypothetical protein